MVEVIAYGRDKRAHIVKSEDIVLDNHPCPLGCQLDDQPMLVGHDRLHNLPGEFQVVRCRACGLMRTDPRPTPETIGFYYPDDYGPYQDTRVNPNKGAEDQRPLWRRFVTRFREQTIKFNSDRLPPLRTGRMLEIGCASGAFLHRMAGEGWEVEGIEFSEKAANSARSLGYRVHTGALETAPDPDKNYDLVVGWMVLEHLHDPVLALRKLRSWTRPGGWLVFSVPNAGSFEFSVFRSAWHATELPRHLYHYTPKALAKVLETGGWKIEKIFYQRVLGDLIASCGYILKDRNIAPSFAEELIKVPERTGRLYYALYPIACLLSIFGQSSRMTIWARREDD